MTLRHIVTAFGLALFAMLILIPLAYLHAQTTGPGTSTLWRVQAHTVNTAMTPYEATTATGARTAAAKACGELGGERAAKCLELLKTRSFASLTASGSNWAAYFLDVEFDAIHQRGTYVSIYAERKD